MIFCALMCRVPQAVEATSGFRSSALGWWITTLWLQEGLVDLRLQGSCPGRKLDTTLSLSCGCLQFPTNLKREAHRSLLLGFWDSQCVSSYTDNIQTWKHFRHRPSVETQQSLQQSPVVHTCSASFLGSEVRELPEFKASLAASQQESIEFCLSTAVTSVCGRIAIP